MKPIRTFLLTLFLFCGALNASAQGAGQWSAERARAWGEQNPWFCGMNYLPANAINYTAMWDKTSFSPEVIDRELALAHSIGLNCARVVMQYAVYADDPKYFLKTFDKFLAICAKHDIKVMPIFFDDCVFGSNTDPVVGKQPEPLEGWYAWAWSPSPGHQMVIDERTHPLLEKYVKDVMTRFKDDERIMVWDLYNEPINGGLGHRSLPLLNKLIGWARTVNPAQPITIGVWCGDATLNDICLQNSDIVTFHCYANAEHTRNEINRLQAMGRPVICTEWMNRPAGSTIETVLPHFHETGAGCMMWGLVNGKSQTDLPWGHKPEHGKYTGPWQHDIFHGDFTPYNTKEIELIKKLSK